MTKPALPKTNAPIKFQATLLSEPKIIGQSAYFTIQHIRIRTNIYPTFNYGDRLEIEGELKSDLIMDFPKITKISEEKKGLGNNIFKVRKFFLDLVAQSLPEPHASLLAGILLGKASLDRDFEADLKKTGTIHTVVVSGFNITVVAGFVL
ncbi:ComEC/Rec2 family competence protein, partial [Candidatus Curtissbacteria bacterium]|nr:ComEC/Rec2 family competence protein [Candidatus Curtissbacteria bacterium]